MNNNLFKVDYTGQVSNVLSIIDKSKGLNYYLVRQKTGEYYVSNLNINKIPCSKDGFTLSIDNLNLEEIENSYLEAIDFTKELRIFGSLDLRWSSAVSLQLNFVKSGEKLLSFSSNYTAHAWSSWDPNSKMYRQVFAHSNFYADLYPTQYKNKINYNFRLNKDSSFVAHGVNYKRTSEKRNQVKSIIDSAELGKIVVYK